MATAQVVSCIVCDCRECLQLLPNKKLTSLVNKLILYSLLHITELIASQSLHHRFFFHNLQRATYYITICQSKILTILGPSLRHDEPVRPRQQVYSVKVVLDGIIEFVTPVSFSYLGLL